MPLTLGDLERTVMDILWAADGPLTAYELQETLGTTAPPHEAAKPLAPTTVLTVLSRLEKKKFVTREKSSRPHRFTATATREDRMAELMHEVLGTATDRTAVLERFVGQASASEAETLRKLLGS